MSAIWTPASFRSRREYLDHCRDVLADLPSRTPAEQRELAVQLETLLKTVPTDWRDGELLGAFADVFGDLGAFKRAVEVYEEAIAHPKAGATLRMVERLANLSERYAKKLQREANPLPEAEKTEKRELVVKISLKAIERLKWLTNFGVTSERLSLLGGAYKRLAQVGPEKQRNENLKKSVEYYQQAYEIYRLRPDKREFYPLINLIAVGGLLAKLENRDDMARLQPYLDEAQVIVAERTKRHRDIWDRVCDPDLRTIRALLSNSLPKHFKCIRCIYRRIVEPGTPEKIKDSMRSQIEFLRELWPCTADRDALRNLEDALK